MTPPDADFFNRYLEELNLLRSMGARFQQRHPDAARRLQLSGDVCPDPHVERLIESFAFLTARIRGDLADDFSEIAGELLQVLYPHFLNPVPSMTIVQFQAARQPDAPTIPRNTPLFAQSREGDVLRFRTCYETTVWPVEVDAVGVGRDSDFGGDTANIVLRVRLRALDKPFEAMNIESLRFFVSEEALLAKLYPRLLGGKPRRVALAPASPAEKPVKAFDVAPVGFGDGDEVIHYPRLGHPAYRLLQEYFAFERKFHFFDVRGLHGLHGKSVELLFFLDGEEPLPALLRPDTFRLGCTPAINLFTRVSEPIRVDHRTHEYLLVADYSRRDATAIHSIDAVSGSSNAAQRSREYTAFYSFTHDMAANEQPVFWHARREAGEIFLSFRDQAFDPTEPDDEVVYAHINCTNADLAHDLEPGDPLQSDQPLQVAKIVTVTKPTRTLPVPEGGEWLWRLISHLSLNYLSIGQNDEHGESLGAMKKILMLYCSSEVPAARQRVDGIKKMTAAKVPGRPDGVRGLVLGTEVTLLFNDELMKGNYLLFADVLGYFLALHSSINSFSRLAIKTDRGEGIKRSWKPGGRQVL